jgi:hypothetical protein
MQPAALHCGSEKWRKYYIVSFAVGLCDKLKAVDPEVESA